MAKTKTSKNEHTLPMEEISITLTPEMMRTIHESVAAGEFASPSEALRDAVHIWQRERADRAERLADIKARIERSVNDPRPSLSQEEMEQHLEELFANVEVERRIA